MSAERTGGTAEVTVSDDGDGLPAEVRETCFELGEQGPESGGDGIGLYPVSRLADVYGGAVDVAGSPSGGRCSASRSPPPLGASSVGGGSPPGVGLPFRASESRRSSRRSAGTSGRSGRGSYAPNPSETTRMARFPASTTSAGSSSACDSSPSGVNHSHSPGSASSSPSGSMVRLRARP
ncbi:hypothetical protein BRC93_12590 [Halobacteriales archaeon QS_5_70_15]|nr:MAG: hypothetical protein BRC93_12590 [Halobacteriales archaeon QS_5_70_15]